MTFSYSICEPLEEEIIYINQRLSGKEILKIANEYPWIEKLMIIENHSHDQIHYNPSLDFKNTINNQSFCLTAHFDEKNELKFSLWYNRPKKIKILFGILGEKTKMHVDDAWEYNLADSLRYLEHFIKGEYKAIEELYK